MKSVQLKQLLIDKYVLLINEYFQQIGNSPIMNTMNFPIYYIYVGITSMHRVFENVILKTKNVNKAYYYAQKSYYYYLEYITQLYDSNILLNLNYADIILFIYNKTIFNLDQPNSSSADEYEDQSNTITNIMVLFENDRIEFDENEFSELFCNLAKMANTMFYWGNKNIEHETRTSIGKFYLSKFLQLPNLDLTQTYLELIQHKLEMPSGEYERLLKEILCVNTAKKSKQRSWTDIEKQEYILTKFYMNQGSLLEKFENNNMNEFVKWVYSV